VATFLPNAGSAGLAAALLPLVSAPKLVGRFGVVAAVDDSDFEGLSGVAAESPTDFRPNVGNAGFAG
jgi:hypothetical protein